MPMSNSIKWIGCAQTNFAVGRGGLKPVAIVIHLMDGTLTGTDGWFLLPRPEAPTSAHYGIGKGGEVHQYVKDEDRAYHAGRIANPSWKGLELHPGINPNSWTIGIEHEGRPADIWTDAMYAASAGLIRSLAAKWGIPLDRMHVCGHHEIYALKPCPGPNCDIDKLIALATAPVEQE